MDWNFVRLAALQRSIQERVDEENGKIGVCVGCERRWCLCHQRFFGVIVRDHRAN